MAKHEDPVCKMVIDEKLAPEKYDYKGETYFFCAKGCKDKFEKEPEKYLARKTK